MKIHAAKFDGLEGLKESRRFQVIFFPSISFPSNSKTPITMYSKTPKVSKADLSFNWREPLPPTAIKKSTVFTTKKEMINPFTTIIGLWSDLTEYKPLEKCEICKTTIRKSVFPQILDSCGHIFCAKCIHTHYIIHNKKTCSVCNQFINIEDHPAFCRICESAPCNCREEESCNYCGDLYCDERCRHDDDNESTCYDDSGELSCGCIDVCRGRCGRDTYW